MKMTSFEKIFRRYLRSSGTEARIKAKFAYMERQFAKALTFSKMIGVILPILSEHFSEDDLKLLGTPLHKLPPEKQQVVGRVMGLMQQALKGYAQRAMEGLA